MSASSMLTMSGTVVHVFKSPDGTDKRTGEAYQGTHKIQLMGQNLLANGESRMDLVTLSTDEPSVFEQLTGRVIAIPVGAFARGNQLHFFIQKGAKLQYLDGGRSAEG